VLKAVPMAQRGRKSAAALALVPDELETLRPLPEFDPPPPPNKRSSHRRSRNKPNNNQRASKSFHSRTVLTVVRLCSPAVTRITRRRSGCDVHHKKDDFYGTSALSRNANVQALLALWLPTFRTSPPRVGCWGRRSHHLAAASFYPQRLIRNRR
jgi:hypothetical protein